jgi:hypothetical protein
LSGETVIGCATALAGIVYRVGERSAGLLSIGCGAAVSSIEMTVDRPAHWSVTVVALFDN